MYVVYTVNFPDFQSLTTIWSWTFSKISSQLHQTQSQRHFVHHQPRPSWLCDLNKATIDTTTKNAMITSDREKANCDKLGCLEVWDSSTTQTVGEMRMKKKKSFLFFLSSVTEEESETSAELLTSIPALSR